MTTPQTTTRKQYLSLASFPTETLVNDLGMPRVVAEILAKAPKPSQRADAFRFLHLMLSVLTKLDDDGKADLFALVDYMQARYGNRRVQSAGSSGK
jgi:hypothetical protein